ncbi:MAG: ATP-binding cassette domain-containing protein [Agathobacter sp.]|nr:ATP-binding cassette domain-containing protein [Agathobacter sp.]
MIVLKDICKKLGENQVLDHISFHISPNENVGIIGLNAAGKTTLLNVIAGVLKPDSGFIRVGGSENVFEDKKMLRKLSYVSGMRHQLWEDLRVKDSFENGIKMYHLDEKRAKVRLEELEELFEIKGLVHMRPQKLSLGERMRCELVYGLLAEPKILMLDEAMIGLDVSVKYKIMEYFQEYRKKRQSTILFTSHNLMEVENLCDRIILLDKGTVIFDGSVERIMKEFAPLYRMKMKTEGILPDFDDLPLEKIRILQDGIEVIYDQQKIKTEQILEHVVKKTQVEEVKLYEPDLEGTIKKIYQKDL